MLLEAQFRSRRSLNHVLYRDRKYRLLLDQAAAAVAQGQSLAAFDQILELAAADEDVFVWDEAAERPTSARAAGRRLIDRLPPEERSRYERYVGAAAQGALASALASGDFANIQAVHVKFPGTSAARRAAQLAAAQSLDSGRIAEAVELWRQVIAFDGIDSLTDYERLQVCTAARLSGDDELHQAAQCESSSPIAVGQVALSLTAWLDRLPSEVDVPSSTSHSTSPHWWTPHGSLVGNRATPGTPPYHVPLWTAASETGPSSSAAASSDHGLASAEATTVGDGGRSPAAAWRQACLDNEEPPATAMSPLVVGGSVITREPEALVGRQLTSGAVQWRHRCVTRLDGQSVADSPMVAEFTQSAAENTLQLTISTDGRRLFYIDSIREPTSAAAPSDEVVVEGDAGARPPLVNCLVALELPEQSAVALNAPPRQLTEAWRIGGAADDAAQLQEHFFLGVPLPHGDRLLVLSECRGQVNLVGLQAATGRVDFVQGLALVDRPLTAESDRLRLSFIPAIRDGLVIAPTPCGAVVAFDLGSRTLRWTAQYRALDTAVSNSWRGDGRAGATLHAVQPVIAGEQVLLLPPDSVELIALRLATGERAWSRPRRGASQLATAGPDRLLLTSSDRVSGHALSTGDILWEQATGCLGGRGVVVGDEFIIARADGRLLGLDTATGRTRTGGPEILAVAAERRNLNAGLLGVAPTAMTGTASVNTSSAIAPLGNLIACGDWIVAASPVETSVYGQAECLLSQSRQSTDRPEDSAADQLRWAELELTLGRGDAALPRLLQLTDSETEADGADCDAAPVRERANLLLRELLYSRLESGIETDEMQALARLSRLANSPIELSRWQVAAAQQAARRGDLDLWLSTAAEIVRCPPDRLVTADVARSRQLHPTAVLDETRLELLERLSAGDRQRLAAAQAAAWPTLAATNDPAALEQYIRLFSAGRSVDRARLQLARTLRMQGSQLAADHWLRDIEAAPGSPVDRNRRRLLAAFHRDGRPLGTMHGSATVVTAEFVPTLRGGETDSVRPAAVVPAAWQTAALELDVDIDWLRRDAPRVELAAHVFPPGAPVTIPDLSALLESRREWATDPSSRLRILNLGESRTSDEPSLARLAGLPDPDDVPRIELALVRRDTAEVSQRLIVPARIRETLQYLQPGDETYLPIADSDLHCLSLRDGARLWTVAVDGGDRSERVRIGACGPDFCLAQSTGGICCLNPLDGTVRWQRRDISPDAGLYGNEEAGLFGDAERIVLVEGDQRTCRVFSTQSGASLARATIPTSDTPRNRIPFGSKLFYCSGGQNEPRVHLWDVATNELLLDEPARYPFRHYRVDRRHVAYVNAAGEVVVLNGLTGRAVLRHALTEAEESSLTEISVWRDRDLWHVQTAHSGLLAGGGRNENMSGELTIPAINVNGVLTVYDADSRDRLWSRTFENHAVAREPRRDVPFLVMLHRTRESLGNTTLEVLDRRTGDVLASLSNLPPAKLCHAGFDPERREYTLYGRLSNGDLQRIDVYYDLPAEGSMFAEN